MGLRNNLENLTILTIDRMFTKILIRKDETPNDIISEQREALGFTHNSGAAPGAIPQCVAIVLVHCQCGAL